MQHDVLDVPDETLAQKGAAAEPPPQVQHLRCDLSATTSHSRACGEMGGSCRAGKANLVRLDDHRDALLLSGAPQPHRLVHRRRQQQRGVVRAAVDAPHAVHVLLKLHQLDVRSGIEHRDAAVAVRDREPVLQVRVEAPRRELRTHGEVVHRVPRLARTQVLIRHVGKAEQPDRLVHTCTARIVTYMNNLHIHNNVHEQHGQLPPFQNSRSMRDTYVGVSTAAQFREQWDSITGRSKSPYSRREGSHR